MTFALEEFTGVKVRSVNVRAEMFGTDPVPAIDVGLHIEGSNDLLSMLDPALKAMLYRKRAMSEQQPELDGVEPVSDLPELRSGAFSMPIALDREYTGITMEIEYGLGGKSNIRVADCEANNFKVETKEGGSVEIDFRIQASGVESGVIGRIGALVRHDIRVKLIAPTLGQDEGTPDLRADASNPFKYTGTAEGLRDNHPTQADAAPEAGDIFAAAHGTPKPKPKPAVKLAPKGKGAAANGSKPRSAA